MGERPDFGELGLLEGLAGAARSAREQLLAALHEQGVAIDDLRRAVLEERLALLPAERVLGEPKYSARELAKKASIDLGLLEAHRRASGLAWPDPDERLYNEADLEAALIVKRFHDAGLPLDGLLETARVFGESSSRAAAAVRTLVAEALFEPGDTELDLARSFATAAADLHEPTGRLLGALFAMHLREQLRNDAIEHESLAAGTLSGVHPVAVGFADLVGFTRLGQSVPPEDLGSIAGRLVAIASDTVSPPVRLVKTIGDAVMLSAPEPEAVLECALDLIAAVESDGGLPDLRAGVAHGPALARWGDLYGAPVNVASRVCGAARPLSVLATREVRDLARDRFSWSRAGPHRLKGVDEVMPLYRCRRPAPDDEPEPEPAATS